MCLQLIFNYRNKKKNNRINNNNNNCNKINKQNSQAKIKEKINFNFYKTIICH